MKQTAEDTFEEAVPASVDETVQTDETDTASEAGEPAAEAEPYTLSGRLLAVGDIMMHSPQFPAYLNPKTGQYDFRGFFTNVKPILKEADWCWANLETPLLGGEKVYTGYPMFNAPPELADALKDAGFNIVTAANNHTLDRRERGALRTREVLKDRGLSRRASRLPVGIQAADIDGQERDNDGYSCLYIRDERNPSS